MKFVGMNNRYFKMEYKKESNELMESQDLLRECMAEALGIYMAKEPKIKDQWKNQQLWEVIEHLNHEVQEIKRSKELDRIYHNALDAIGQASIIASWCRLEQKRLHQKKGD